MKGYQLLLGLLVSVTLGISSWTIYGVSELKQKYGVIERQQVINTEAIADLMSNQKKIIDNVSDIKTVMADTRWLRESIEEVRKTVNILNQKLDIHIYKP